MGKLEALMHGSSTSAGIVGRTVIGGLEGVATSRAVFEAKSLIEKAEGVASWRGK